MKKSIVISLALLSLVQVEAYARGFGGGGGFGGGHFGGGGGFDRGSFGGGGGGFGRGGGDFDRGGFDRGSYGNGGFDRGGYGNGGFDRGNAGNEGFRNSSIDSDPNRGVWNNPDRGNFTSGVWNRPATGGGIGQGGIGNRGIGNGGIGQGGKFDPNRGGFGFDHISGNGNNVFKGGHNTYNYSPTYMNNRGLAVRNGFNGYGHFYGNGWYGHYPGCWYAPGWGASTAWMITDWSMMAGMLAMSAATPLLYGYGGGGGGGGSVTYNNNNVYYGDQPVASAEDYYNQAQTLATQGPTAPNYASPVYTSGSGATPPAVPTDFNPATTAKLDKSAKKSEWKPLGVFSLVQGDQTNSTTMFQLAINAKGDIAGNYYDMLTDQDQQVHGHLDKKTQRVAFTVGKNQAVVYDCGLGNLMTEQAPILVHFDKSRTEQFLLVRLKRSDAQQKQS